MRVFLLIFLMSIAVMPQKRLMTIDDLWAMERINKISITPDGNKIFYSSSVYSMQMNKGNSNISSINADGSGRTEIKATEKNESSPVFVPALNKLAFIYNDQIWLCDPDGANEQQITNYYAGVNSFKFSNDGKYILFTASVYPSCGLNNECNENKDKLAEESKVKASVFTELYYRDFNHWRGDKRSHLFLLDVANKKDYELTPGAYYDVPPVALGSDNDFNFSPEGSEIAFTANKDRFLATSTNNDIWVVNLNEVLRGGEPNQVKISQSEGSDCEPVFSPDGNYIAFTSMERKGFEADKKRIMLYNRKSGDLADISAGIDLSADNLIWSPDSKKIYFIASSEVYNQVYSVDIETKQLLAILTGMNIADLQLTADGSKFLFRNQSSIMPYEIFSANTNGTMVTRITYLNQKVLNQMDWNGIETFTVKGAGGTPVQSIMVKPAGFNPSAKYPLIFLIHGGPQGNWSDEFHYRWNLQMFAAGGYVVIAPNPRGSTGYGQKFTDEISQDWGGKVYEDLMNVYDYALKNFAFLDSNNTFAAGASYGGYMINWIAGHTNRFKALVSHAGVFNLESMYGTTEQLWFPEWEMGGTPWSNRKAYEKWSPHQFIQNCKTPMLVVHGGNDFRVPEEQAFQLFTSLQRLGIESKFLYFPDETHFVAKPQNSRLWWLTVYDWFEKHYTPGSN
ncbi:MAG: S9 family peptidase [Ignavibacteriales bacterium]|nr:Dipeptidyl-peptidase 5 [Ignavibacteriaceae bacterium]MCZ2144126.1 S9 family peptidase [Ignavibacteriales bacterium]WKZ72609.1 MAG: S9 family peptidase [Ignavibacteriaceae bacterium]